MIEHLVRRIVSRRHLVLALATCAFVASVVLASRLRLVSDLAALLPRDSPAVKATERVRERLGDVLPVQVAIESPDRQANLAFAEAVTRAVQHELAGSVDSVTYHIEAERQFFKRNWWEYLELSDLELVLSRIERELTWRKNPLLVDLEDDDGPLDELRERIKERTRRADKFPDGYFMSKDGTLVVVVVWPAAGAVHGSTGDALLPALRTVVAAQQPSAYHPAMHVGYVGATVDAARERRALESDLLWASLACLVLVSVVVALFFGRVRAVPMMAAPGLLGVGVALAVAYLAFGQLNASTAFLGSIILGNGINAAIIQLARYQEERRGGAIVGDALERSVTTTIRATAIASFAAAISYGSLMVTSFRGFSEFGLIGAVGIVASWIASILVLPALIAVVDRDRARLPAAAPRGVAFGVPFARIATRAPRRLAVLAAAITVGALVIFVPYARDPFEYDLRALGSVQPAGQRELAARTGAIFGQFTPTVLLADTQDQAVEAASILRTRRAACPGVLADVWTLDDLLPGPVAVQQQKLSVIDDIRRKFEGVPLSADEQAKLAEWKPPANLTPITAGELPPSLLRPFRDRSGRPAPIVLAYRDPQISYWNGRDLMRLARAVDDIELRDGTTIYAGGTAVVFADMLEAIVHDGPIATLASLIGVTLLALLLVRGRGVIAVLGALVTGVVWMLGGAALAGVRVNFLNFIALPLTFGIGIDYAVNVYLRHRLDGPGRMTETLRATGGAVALCSLTTMIGYASLLLADSRGLRSFGALAILGEIACLSAALLVMPAWLLVLERRRKSHAHAPTPG